MAWFQAVSTGKLLAGSLKPGILCDWWWEHICFFLVGPKLEMGTKLEKLSAISQVLASWDQLLEITARLPTSPTYSRLGSWAVHCG